MKIVADDAIPFLDHWSYPEGIEWVFVPGEAVNKTILADADALLVRSITPIDKALLEGTAVAFVGTATAGVDHVDTAWLEHQGVGWQHAHGANARSVAEYVIACIASFLKTSPITCRRPRAGVLGVGAVGSLVVSFLEALGCDVLAYDPPREQRDPAFSSASFSEMSQLDIICLHMPLSMGGPDATHHLVDAAFMMRQHPGACVISAGRGGVVDCSRLLDAGKHLVWCLDVWEGEPCIDEVHLAHAWIATPHIAGYGRMSKWNATACLVDALAEAFSFEVILKDREETEAVFDLSHTVSWQDAILACYNPHQETQWMRDAFSVCDSMKEREDVFHRLRKTYPLRPSFQRDVIPGAWCQVTQGILHAFGMRF